MQIGFNVATGPLIEPDTMHRFRDGVRSKLA